MGSLLTNLISLIKTLNFSGNSEIQYRRNLIKQNTHLIFSILVYDSKLKIEQNDILLEQCTDSEPINQFLHRMAKIVGPALDERHGAHFLFMNINLVVY